ncbi:hypothetical protein AVEN_100332-1 [Araneus ventricosus]|uniref:Uncharacterized protein n=1 Tax=Araneus ventricosus TaxID=182803 RepID=A0A4Y2UDA5_ARAVE|nr:hypothetical protein AVEN_100332-1 [Araneus ventricosus]
MVEGHKIPKQTLNHLLQASQTTQSTGVNESTSFFSNFKILFFSLIPVSPAILHPCPAHSEIGDVVDFLFFLCAIPLRVLLGVHLIQSIGTTWNQIKCPPTSHCSKLLTVSNSSLDTSVLHLWSQNQVPKRARVSLNMTIDTECEHKCQRIPDAVFPHQPCLD